MYKNKVIQYGIGLSLFLSPFLFNSQKPRYLIRMLRQLLKGKHFEESRAIEAYLMRVFFFSENGSPTFYWEKLSFWMTLDSFFHLPLYALLIQTDNSHVPSYIMAWFSRGYRENGLSLMMHCSEPFHLSLHSSREKDKHFLISENPSI